VHASTGFEPPRERRAVALPASLRRIADEAHPIYQRLRSHRLASLPAMSEPRR
jgi:hypothetical protein